MRATNPPAPTLALVAGVAVQEAIETFMSAGDLGSDARFKTASQVEARRLAPDQVRGDDEVSTVTLKWPNDLLLRGAKLAGILLERADDAVVIGVGVNLAHHPDLPDRPTTSLATHGIDLSPETLLDTLAETFARWLSRWRGEGLTSVRVRWLERAHPIGTALTTRLPNGTSVDGLFGGLDSDGALILRLAGGERRVIHAGDVFLL